MSNLSSSRSRADHCFLALATSSDNPPSIPSDVSRAPFRTSRQAAYPARQIKSQRLAGIRNRDRRLSALAEGANADGRGVAGAGKNSPRPRRLST